MKATLYSTHCPCCKALEERLRQAEIEYTVISNTEQILALKGRILHSFGKHCKLSGATA